MKTLVIYDSGFGNTEKIARAIGEALEGEVIIVSNLSPAKLEKADMIFIGSPTHGGKPSNDIQEFLKNIPDRLLEGTATAAFDTRLSAKWLGIIGYAAGKIERLLKAKGANSIISPEGFLVNGKEGPLKDGELERAACWAKSASRVTARL